MNLTECKIQRNLSILKVFSILFAVFVSFFIYKSTNASLIFCLILLGVGLLVIYLIYKELYKVIAIQTVLGKHGEGIGNKASEYLDKLFYISK